MTSSDWVQIGATLLLGVIALFVAICGPYLGEQFKLRVMSPKLTIRYQHGFSDCYKVAWFNPQNPTTKADVYFFHFQIINEGKSQARKVEAIIEKLYERDISGEYKEVKFVPFKLRIDESGTTTIDINPTKRHVLWAIGHISTPAYQNESEKPRFIDIPNKNTYPGVQRFMIEQMAFSYAGPNCLFPGNYRVLIALYSENAEVEKALFSIDWSGNWREAEQEMYSEIIIKLVKTTF